MHVVIFRAETGRLDATYDSLARELRDLALHEFGCLRFEASCEAGVEIAVSWWPDEAAIQRWRHHPRHLEAQRSGRAAWYTSYDVTVARVTRSYVHGP